VPISIGTSIVGLQAQRRLNESSAFVARSVERLSSGLRVNRASDDSAGLAVAAQLTLSTRVFTQAIRNGNDGLSALTIADSALGSLTEVVTRIRELATQASNGAYTSQQRKALDSEAQALSKEYLRIIQGTSFNNVALLDGSLGSGLRLQLGFGTDGGINAGVGGSIGTGDFGQESLLGSNIDATTGDVNNDGIVDIVGIGANSINVRLGIGDGTFSAATSYTASGVTALALGDINNDGTLDIVSVAGSNLTTWVNSGSGGYTATSTITSSIVPLDVAIADVTGDGKNDLVASGNNSGSGAVSVRVGGGDATFGAEQITATGGTSSRDLQLGDLNGDGLLDVAVANSSGSSGTASFLISAGGGSFSLVTTITIGGDSGSNVALGDIDGDGRLDAVTGNTDNAYQARRGNGDGTFGAILGISDNDNVRNFSLRDINGDGRADLIGATTADQIFTATSQGNGTLGDDTVRQTGSFQIAKLILDDFNSDGVFDVLTTDNFATSAVYLGLGQDGTAPLLPFSLTSKAEAMQAVGRFDATLNNLTEQRGSIGAFQSRIMSALNALSANRENFLGARSRIVDSDVAAESAQLVRAQIAQQSATAILAQANQQPLLALRLLQEG
jgi:flagellin